MKTVTGYVPGFWISVAKICAVNCVALTKVVARATPLKRTTELLLKLVPLTVSVKAVSPAVLLVGLMLLNIGTGLLTVKLTGLDSPLPGVGLKTVMG